MRKYLRIAIWIALALFIIRVFVYQTYKVDSFSMSSSLLPGDRVLINKLKTGSRFPVSILGLPGADRKYIDAFRVPYFRLPAFRKFKRNDIVVFNDPRLSDSPIDRSPLIVSRISGIPGDTVIILNKDLYINREIVPNKEKFRRHYRVVTDGSPIPESFINEYELSEPTMITDIGIYDLYMDTTAYLAAEELPEVKTIRSKKQFYGDSSRGYFPYSSFFKWNRDQYGPLIVPSKGIELAVSLNNIDLYREIISIYEGNDLLVDYSGVTINGRKADTYTFKNNYYFVMDDNRDNPNDSRIIGFIPASHLLGTGKRILFSGKSEYDYINKSKAIRFLKSID